MTFRGSIMKWSFYLLNFDCSAQVCGEFFQLIKYFIALLSSTIFNGPHFWSKFSLTILAAFSKMTLVWAESRYQRFYNCKLWRIRFNVLFQILFSWKTLFTTFAMQWISLWCYIITQTNYHYTGADKLWTIVEQTNFTKILVKSADFVDPYNGVDNIIHCTILK